jgi:hypothetical protein
LIDCLGRCQVVTDWADAAQALYGHRYFPIRPALDEFLEAAKFNDVQPRLADVVIAIRQKCDLAVTFNPTQRIDSDPT